MKLVAFRKPFTQLLTSLGVGIKLMNLSHPRVALYSSHRALNAVAAALTSELGEPDSWGGTKQAVSTATWTLASGMRLHLFTEVDGRTKLLLSALTPVQERDLMNSLGVTTVNGQQIVEYGPNLWALRSNPLLMVEATNKAVVRQHDLLPRAGGQSYRFATVGSWTFSDLPFAADFACALEAVREYR